MRCNDARELMLEQLDDDDERRLREHLDACPECAAEWNAVAGVESLLRAQALVDPPVGFAARVEKAIALECERPPSWQLHLAQAAWILTGLLVTASGLVSLLGGWRTVIQDPRWSVVYGASARGASIAFLLVAEAVDGGALVWLMYGLLAAVMAVFWFGALIVPRFSTRPLRSFG